MNYWYWLVLAVSLVSFVVFSALRASSRRETELRKLREQQADAEEKYRLRVENFLTYLQVKLDDIGVDLAMKRVDREGFLPSMAALSEPLACGLYLLIEPEEESDSFTYYLLNVNVDRAQAQGDKSVFEAYETLHFRLYDKIVWMPFENVDDITSYGVENSAQWLVNNLLHYQELWQRVEDFVPIMVAENQAEARVLQRKEETLYAIDHVLEQDREEVVS